KESLRASVKLSISLSNLWSLHHAHTGGYWTFPKCGSGCDWDIACGAIRRTSEPLSHTFEEIEIASANRACAETEKPLQDRSGNGFFST
ncbi:hypothetical protein, partial [Caballeronia sordidicola]|uniref:hypothetical protein n=1 Tax=Caballeronia sordidicola TaxID=196367 RepID=UPI001C5326E8